MGHALNNTIQDILIRFNRMRGRCCEWMPGTDHAGIATQNVVERKLAKEGKRRHEMGREAFVREVWRWREEYGSTIIRQLKKLGCSCDWERTRFTMDETLSAAVLEVFVRLYEKGLVYRGNYIINWCPRCQTALSDEESQHRDVEGMLYYIKYPVKAVREFASSRVRESKDRPTDPQTLKPENPRTREPANFIIVATTRPETMLGDVAVAINPNDERYKDLHGMVLELPLVGRDLKVILDGMVDPKFGTGALKVTPAHDPVDFELGRKHGLEEINVMNDDATINSLGGDYEGMDRFEAREAILEDLKERGLLLKTEPHRHAVGHCYRCHTMVEPRLSPQWFVRMKPLAAPAIEAVKDGRITFHPARWTKVYLDWMENIRDWCISRQIWWGHRIPVYYCKKCAPKAGTESPSGVIVSKTPPEKCPDCGGVELEQDPDVLDTWFSSWLWPFSTLGWPKDTPELGYFYPTDALVTAQEIIFFWVARMIMAGFEFMGAEPFRHVYIHGTVRDMTGTKMSKSLGNTIDPLDMIAKYGTDALRFSIISITAQGQDVFLSESKFELGRNFANKLWNAARFIMANLKDRREAAGDLRSLIGSGRLTLAQRWIISRCFSTLRYVGECLDQFKFNEAANAIYEFVWHELCDWYIEIAKSSIGEEDTQAILCGLLEIALRMLHPFMPFITEEIWQKLPRAGSGGADSIMLADWPAPEPGAEDGDSEERMRRLISAITAIRNIRSVWNIDPRTEVDAIANVPAGADAALLAQNADMVRRLARVRDFRVGGHPKPRNSAASIVGPVEIYVPLEGLIDFGKESARLAKEHARMASEFKALEGRLRNSEFLAKAPGEVIEAQRARKAELEEQMKKLNDNLKEISG
jgi:valyl-tRNA synthetase